MLTRQSFTRKGTALALLAFSRVAQAQPVEDPFVSLVAAEQNFAADARRFGITPAFRSHAASDSVLLRPEPVAALDHLATQVDAPDLSLEWWPAMAGIASSGDLGFTTGPYRVAQGKRVLDGQFLTIWSRGADRRWRWFLDHGLPAQPEALSVPLPRQVTRFAAATPATADDLGNGLDAAEQVLNAAYIEKGIAGLLPVLAEDGYLLRPRNLPLRKAEVPGLAPDARRFGIAERLGMRVSAAGDLAASYGRLVPSAGPPAYYVRVWRRNGTRWQLLIDELG